ncbi:MAG: hypothetical protein NUW37_19555 [Planctomycetes bacterium]|nr:hypothetical protein [Planctomycetota bacterium]
MAATFMNYADLARTLILDPEREREELEKRYSEEDLVKLTVEQVRGDIEQAVERKTSNAMLFLIDDNGGFRYDLVIQKLKNLYGILIEEIKTIADEKDIEKNLKEGLLRNIKAAYAIILEGFSMLESLPSEKDFEIAGVAFPAIDSSDRSDPLEEYPACEALLGVLIEHGEFQKATEIARYISGIASKFCDEINYIRAEIVKAIGVGEIAPGNERLALGLKALAKPGLVERVEKGLEALDRAEREGTLVWDDR